MPSAATVTGSHLIARALRQEGVRNIFVLAGDHVLPVMDVLSQGDVRFIDTRHEQAAVHMADAWGRITGQPGVAMYTSPGFANAIPGLSSAFHSESPLLSISGSAPLHELGRGAMQELDQISMARPVTKGAWLVTDPRRIPDIIAQALRTAYSGRRGPVHLTVPVDVQQRAVPEDEVAFYQPREYRFVSPALADANHIKQVVALLHQAQRPLIIAGSAASYSGCGDALQRFIETTRLPLMTEGDARGLVPDDHPCCFGFFDSGLNRAAPLLKKADVVMLLGRKQDGILGYAMPPTISQDARLVQVDPSAAEIGRNRGVAVGIVGDVDAVIEQLTGEAATRKWSELEWLRQLRAEREAQGNSLDELAVPEAPMHAMQVHKTLKPFLRRDDYLVFDGGDFCHFGRAYIPALGPKRWLYLPPLGMLGSALPTALAAKLAHPRRRVVMLTGDGSFGFNAMEYDTAVRHNLPIVGIMGNDAAWGIDRQIQLGVFGRAVATDLLPARYDRLVRGLGGYGEHVATPQELPGAIHRAFDSDLPSLLNVDVQRAISPRAEAAIDRWKSESLQPF